MKYAVLTGRILFAIIFIMAGFSHFSSQAVAYANAAGVPAAGILVPLSGIISFIGALSIAAGYKAKIGAWALVIFLLPVTFMMHNFWAAPDAMKQLQMSMFIKNLALVGAALFIAYFGAGPLSVDAYLQKSKNIKTDAQYV